MYKTPSGDQRGRHSVASRHKEHHNLKKKIKNKNDTSLSTHPQHQTSRQSFDQRPRTESTTLTGEIYSVYGPNDNLRSNSTINPKQSPLTIPQRSHTTKSQYNTKYYKLTRQRKNKNSLNKNIARHFTTTADAAATTPEKQSLTFSQAYNRFVLAIHPDLFEPWPEAQEKNTIALGELNAVISSAKDNDLAPKMLPLTFYLKPPVIDTQGGDKGTDNDGKTKDIELKNLYKISHSITIPSITPHDGGLPSTLWNQQHGFSPTTSRQDKKKKTQQQPQTQKTAQGLPVAKCTYNHHRLIQNLIKLFEKASLNVNINDPNRYEFLFNFQATNPDQYFMNPNDPKSSSSSHPRFVSPEDPEWGHNLHVQHSYNDEFFTPSQEKPTNDDYTMQAGFYGFKGKFVDKDDGGTSPDYLLHVADSRYRVKPVEFPSDLTLIEFINLTRHHAKKTAMAQRLHPRSKMLESQLRHRGFKLAFQRRSHPVDHDTTDGAHINAMGEFIKMLRYYFPDYTSPGQYAENMEHIPQTTEDLIRQANEEGQMDDEHKPLHWEYYQQEYEKQKYGRKGQKNWFGGAGPDDNKKNSYHNYEKNNTLNFDDENNFGNNNTDVNLNEYGSLSNSAPQHEQRRRRAELLHDEEKRVLRESDLKGKYINEEEEKKIVMDENMSFEEKSRIMNFRRQSRNSGSPDMAIQKAPMPMTPRQRELADWNALTPEEQDQKHQEFINELKNTRDYEYERQRYRQGPNWTPGDERQHPLYKQIHEWEQQDPVKRAQGSGQPFDLADLKYDEHHDLVTGKVYKLNPFIRRRRAKFRSQFDVMNDENDRVEYVTYNFGGYNNYTILPDQSRSPNLLLGSRPGSVQFIDVSHVSKERLLLERRAMHEGKTVAQITHSEITTKNDQRLATELGQVHTIAPNPTVGMIQGESGSVDTNVADKTTADNTSDVTNDQIKSTTTATTDAETDVTKTPTTSSHSTTTTTSILDSTKSTTKTTKTTHSTIADDNTSSVPIGSTTSTTTSSIKSTSTTASDETNDQTNATSAETINTNTTSSDQDHQKQRMVQTYADFGTRGDPVLTTHTSRPSPNLGMQIEHTGHLEYQLQVEQNEEITEAMWLDLRHPDRPNAPNKNTSNIPFADWAQENMPQAQIYRGFIGVHIKNEEEMKKEWEEERKRQFEKHGGGNNSYFKNIQKKLMENEVDIDGNPLFPDLGEENQRKHMDIDEGGNITNFDWFNQQEQILTDHVFIFCEDATSCYVDSRGRIVLPLYYPDSSNLGDEASGNNDDTQNQHPFDQQTRHKGKTSNQSTPKPPKGKRYATADDWGQFLTVNNAIKPLNQLDLANITQDMIVDNVVEIDNNGVNRTATAQYGQFVEAEVVHDEPSHSPDYDMDGKDQQKIQEEKSAKDAKKSSQRKSQLEEKYSHGPFSTPFSASKYLESQNKLDFDTLEEFLFKNTGIYHIYAEDILDLSLFTKFRNNLFSNYTEILGDVVTRLNETYGDVEYINTYKDQKNKDKGVERVQRPRKRITFRVHNHHDQGTDGNSNDKNGDIDRIVDLEGENDKNDEQFKIRYSQFKQQKAKTSSNNNKNDMNLDDSVTSTDYSRIRKRWDEMIEEYGVDPDMSKTIIKAKSGKENENINTNITSNEDKTNDPNKLSKSLKYNGTNKDIWADPDIGVIYVPYNVDIVALGEFLNKYGHITIQQNQQYTNFLDRYESKMAQVKSVLKLKRCVRDPGVNAEAMIDCLQRLYDSRFVYQRVFDGVSLRIGFKYGYTQDGWMIIPYNWS